MSNIQKMEAMQKAREFLYLFCEASDSRMDYTMRITKATFNKDYKFFAERLGELIDVLNELKKTLED